MNIALLLSGGRGLRAGGDIPKQYIEVGGRPMIYYAMKILMLHEMIDALYVVAEDEYHELIYQVAEDIANESNKPALADMLKGMAKPGANRQLSILNGLRVLRKSASDADTVLIHDAARPCLSHQLILDCYEAIIGHQGVLPVLPMKDTVYFSNNGKEVTGLLDRSRVFAGQAPELFLIGPYYDANEELLPDKILDIRGSTEPAVLAGMDVVLIPGDERNVKITTKEDLENFRAYNA